MHATRTLAFAGLILAGLTVSGVSAQTLDDLLDLVPTVTDPTSGTTTGGTDRQPVDPPNSTFGSTKASALSKRAPGNWIKAAQTRSPEITREDPHGEDFLPQLYLSMSQAFWNEINSFIASLVTLLDLSSLLDGFDLSGLVKAPGAIGRPIEAIPQPTVEITAPPVT